MVFLAVVPQRSPISRIIFKTVLSAMRALFGAQAHTTYQTAPVGSKSSAI